MKHASLLTSNAIQWWHTFPEGPLCSSCFGVVWYLLLVPTENMIFTYAECRLNPHIISPYHIYKLCLLVKCNIIKCKWGIGLKSNATEMEVWLLVKQSCMDPFWMFLRWGIHEHAMCKMSKLFPICSHRYAQGFVLFCPNPLCARMGFYKSAV